MNSVLGTVKIGQHYAFRYCFDYPGTIMPELRERIGQQCLVLLLSQETEGEMENVYRVRFPDGYEVDAFEEELEDSGSLMTPFTLTTTGKPASKAAHRGTHCPVCTSTNVSVGGRDMFVRDGDNPNHTMAKVREHRCSDCGEVFWR